MDIDNIKLEKIKIEAEEIYKKIDKVMCPYLKSDIIFNAKGLEHIKFKRRRVARSGVDQYVRLKLISLAPRILQMSHTLQGIFEGKSLEYVKINSRWEYIVKNVIYYEFVAVIKRTRVRIIVKEVEGGVKYFWSIIPFWKQKNNEKFIHNGNPEID